MYGEKLPFYLHAARVLGASSGGIRRLDRARICYSLYHAQNEEDTQKKGPDRRTLEEVAAVGRSWSAVLAVAGVTGSYLYVRSYLKSDSFLSMRCQSAIDDMNVDDARIEPLEWDGSGIRCGGVTMQGHDS